MFNILYFIIFYLYFMWLLPLFIILLRPFSKLLGIEIDGQLMSKIFYKVMSIKQEIIKKEDLIEKGFIFSNHRCWADFAIDNYTMDSSPLGRYLAFIMMGFWTVNGMIDNRSIMFARGKANRKYIYDLCKKNMEKEGYYNKRTLLYPEGTRMNYKILESKEDIKSKLKMGLIKEIYQRNEFPIQLIITSNKENVLNEKKLTLKRNVTIKSAISKSIHPKDFNCFDNFVDKICQEWFHLWNLTHC